MPKRLWPAVLALAIVALTVAVIVSLSPGHDHPSPSSSQGSANAGAGASASANANANNTNANTGQESEFDGAPLPAGTIAPDFTLTDQRGRRISLSEYRGQVVLVTFLYSTCGAACIVIAQQIRGALDELDDGHARPPAVLIVSADPAADTAAHISHFLAEVSLTGRVQYLTGDPAQLGSIWRAYHVHPASSGAAAFDDFASVLLVDRRGRERVLFESEELTPEALSHDIGKLDGDPTDP